MRLHSLAALAIVYGVATLGIVAACGGCGTIPVPEPTPTPTPPTPPPVPPGPPPPVPATGAITDAQFAATADGMTVDEMHTALGTEFGHPRTAAGFLLFTYVARDHEGAYYFFTKNGVVDHRSRYP